MGADLYLARTVEQTLDQYHELDQLVDQMHELSHQDIVRVLQAGAQTLFAQVQAWATQHAVPPELFDAASQVRDLAQAETQAWLRTFLAEQVITIEQQTPASPSLALARHLSQLACGHTEAHLHPVIEQLQRCLQLHTAQSVVPPAVLTARTLLSPLAALVLHQDPTRALAQARDAVLQTIERQQTTAQALDAALLTQARRVHRACNLPESQTLVQQVQQWVAFTRQHALDLVAAATVPGDLLSTILAGHQQGATTLTHHRSAVMAVMHQLGTTNHHEQVALTWIEFTRALTVRLAFAQQSERELVEHATTAVLLAQSEHMPWLRAQAERLVEALRPPLQLPEPEDADVWQGDERPTMRAWRQLHQVALREAKQLQEARPLPNDACSPGEIDPAFALAVQLRDLLHQDPSSRMCWIADELVALLNQEAPTQLRRRAEELRGLIHGDPSGCLHTALSHIQDGVQARAQQEPEGMPAQLLISIHALQALLAGEVQAPLLQLMGQIQATLTHKDITDPELRSTLGQLPTVIEQGAGDALQEVLHQVMVRLRTLRVPPEAYFRDPYHPAGLLLRLDLDWIRDVLPRLEPDTQCLSLDEVRRFAELVEEAQLQPISDQEWQGLLRFHPVLGETLSTPEALQERLRQKQAELLQFLRRALAQEEPVYCDL